MCSHINSVRGDSCLKRTLEVSNSLSQNYWSRMMHLKWWHSLILNQTVEPKEIASDLAFSLTRSGRRTVFTVHSWVGSALGFPPKRAGRVVHK